MLFGGFLKKFRLNWNFKLNITDGITDGLKSRRWYLTVFENLISILLTESPTEYLKILIFNYPSVKSSAKHPNKKSRISNFTTNKAHFFFFFFFFFFPICKKHQYPFLSLLSSTPSFLLHAQVCIFLLLFSS